MSRDMWISLLATGVFASACGGGASVSPPPPPPPPPPASPIMAKATPSGDAQSGVVGTVLPSPIRVLITQGGNPKMSQGVNWQIGPSGGSVDPTASATDVNGVAFTMVTLPAIAVTSTITATATGVTGSPLTFTATSAGASLAVTVNVVNFQFDPANAALKQGGTVTFVWGAASGPHTVTPDGPNTIPVIPGDPTTQTSPPPFTFDVVFPATGTFDYHCRVHGAPRSGMAGRITVVP
jgi:plastocyanin